MELLDKLSCDKRTCLRPSSVTSIYSIGDIPWYRVNTRLYLLKWSTGVWDLTPSGELSVWYKVIESIRPKLSKVIKRIFDTTKKYQQDLISNQINQHKSTIVNCVQNNAGVYTGIPVSEIPINQWRCNYQKRPKHWLIPEVCSHKHQWDDPIRRRKV